MKKLLFVLAIALVMVVPATADTFYDSFNYLDGDLIGQGGWYGDAGSQIAVQDGKAVLTFDTAFSATCATIDFDPISGGKIYWSIRVWGVQGPAGNTFDMGLNDANGYNFARWYGGYLNDRPRINGTSQVLKGVALVENEWNLLTVEVDTLDETSTFFHNGVNLGSMIYSLNQPEIGNAATNLYIGFQNQDSSKNGATKYYDDLWISTEGPVPVPEPSALLALGTFGVGMIGYIKRRNA